MTLKHNGYNISVYISRELAKEVREKLNNGNFSELVCSLLREWLEKTNGDKK